jgi:RNA-directed DNA polymerase
MTYKTTGGKDGLRKRGLELSQEKTKITHIDAGFDFLGFNLRKYKGKLLIKPAKKGIQSFLTDIREIIHLKRADKAEELISILNSKIQGWANHFRHVVAKKVFSYVDANIFKALWRWAKRRHPKKSKSWIKVKYFTRIGLRNWCFFSQKTAMSKQREYVVLKSASDTRIVRHVKIKGAATPYDPEFDQYFTERTRKQRMQWKYSRVS